MLGVNSPLLAVVVLVVTSRIFVKAKLRTLAFEDALVVLSTVGLTLHMSVVLNPTDDGIVMYRSSSACYWG